MFIGLLGEECSPLFLDLWVCSNLGLVLMGETAFAHLCIRLFYDHLYKTSSPGSMFLLMSLLRLPLFSGAFYLMMTMGMKVGSGNLKTRVFSDEMIDSIYSLVANIHSNHLDAIYEENPFPTPPMLSCDPILDILGFLQTVWTMLFILSKALLLEPILMTSCMLPALLKCCPLLVVLCAEAASCPPSLCMILLHWSYFLLPFMMTLPFVVVLIIPPKCWKNL